MDCSNCKTKTDDPTGLCEHCYVDMRNSIRAKLTVFLSDPTNFSWGEWKVLYDTKNNILNNW